MAGHAAEGDPTAPAMSRPARWPADLRTRWKDPLGRSVLSLYAIQIASYVVPLVSFPYLLRTLGPSAFGLYGFIIAFGRVGNLITDWGFQFSSTRDIAQRLERREPVDPTFSAAMWARMGLLSLWALVVAVLTTQVDRFAEDAELYWISFVSVAGFTLFPVWLFQAFERLPLVTAANLAFRAVATALIFVLVTSPADVDRALWLWAAPWILTAAFALWAARARLRVRWIPQSGRAIWAATREGTSIFVMLAAASAYTAANALLLGLMTDTEQVGYFVAAETVILAAIGLVGPLSQAIFPRASRNALAGPDAALAHARRVLPWFLALGAALSVGILLTAPIVGPIVFGDDFDRSIRLLQIMSVIPLAVGCYAVLGAQLMLPLRLDRVYSAVLIAVGVGSLALTFALVPRLEATGTAISATTAEVSIVVALLVILHRRGLRLWPPPAARDPGQSP